MAGNTFEKVKLGAKEVAEIFTDSDTYLGSKMKIKTWNFRMKQEKLMNTEDIVDYKSTESRGKETRKVEVTLFRFFTYWQIRNHFILFFSEVLY